MQSLSTSPMSADVRKEILDKGTRTQAKNTSIKIRANVNQSISLNVSELQCSNKKSKIPSWHFSCLPGAKDL